MSYIPLQAGDSIIVQDAITAPLWSQGKYNLDGTSLYTSSIQAAGTQGQAYLNVYNLPASAQNSELQFAIAYGHVSGSGSAPFNPAIPDRTPTRDVYGQFGSLLYGETGGQEPFTFGGGTVSGSRDIFVINVSRARYKESLKPGSLNMTLTSGSNSIQLTDNSKDVNVTSYIGSNRVYSIVSGSNGSSYNGNAVQTASGSYGLFFPDTSTIILNPRALSLSVGNNGIALPIDETLSTSYAQAIGTNSAQLYSALFNGGNFSLNSLETITSRYFNIKVNFQELNYTTNPSVIDANGNIIYSTLVDNPETYITSIGLYNNQNELMGVAKLSTPLKKSFTGTLNLKVKLQS
jgi:hypothetical protein